MPSENTTDNSDTTDGAPLRRGPDLYEAGVQASRIRRCLVEDAPLDLRLGRALAAWGTDSPLRVTGMMVTARVANLGRAQRAPLEMRAAGEKNASL